MKGKLADTGNGPIEYTLRGAGPVVLMLHGMSQDCQSDNGHDAFINQGFCVLTPSRPGYGRTPAYVGDSAEKASDAVAALLQYLNIEKASIIAISGGGPTGLFFAANHPGKVRKLVLVSALSKPWQDEARYLAVKKFYGRSFPITWSLLKVFSVLFPGMTAKRTISLFSTHDPDDFMKHLTRPEIIAMLRLYKSKAYRQGPLIDLKSQPDENVLKRINVPTLVVHSKEDKSVDFQNAEYSHQYIKAASLYISPTWSHFPWFGPCAEDELDKVIGFLK